MKARIQVALVLVLLGAVVAGVTYVSIYTGGPPADSKAGPSAQSVLSFGETQSRPIADCEEGSKGNIYDFWFHNPTGSPVEVRFDWKSCTCTDLQIGLLPAGACSGWLERPFEPHALGDGLLAHAEWHKLSSTPGAEDTVTVPPNDSTRGPVWGVIRFTWEAKERGPKRLGAIFSAAAPGVIAKPVELSVTANIVAPLRLTPEVLTVGSVTADEQKTAECLVWSSTRDHFTVKQIEVLPPDPCVTVALTPLTLAECGKYFNDMKLNAERTQAKCGSKLTVTVRERTDAGAGGPVHSHDLGAMEREIRLTTDIGEPLTAMLRGIIRGDIHIIGDDREIVQLGNFPSTEGTSRTILIGSTRPGVELDVDRSLSYPTYLNATIEKGSEPSRWRLRVSVGPKQASGELPPQSVVVLVTNDSPPRRFRLPVRGGAYRQ
jgi:hypothetical protein